MDGQHARLNKSWYGAPALSLPSYFTVGLSNIAAYHHHARRLVYDGDDTDNDRDIPLSFIVIFL